MTGKAGIGQIVCQGDVQRRVGVLVTFQAAFKFKMLLAGVAHAALGNNVGVVGRMALMAINTGNAGLVLAACAFNGLRCSVMAFCTVGNA